ncbi:endolytic transglycosylase MltG [Inconstantimicrobium mannanitabidum]|uniref:Cell division protein YceG n=1 Tax=Inconstantimicrobium mannanitabidum TaxID=1604901 RepID=A0ACB5RBK8_9CLOT|nr:endolytic transglycosylase MltG [Clostridium sp. TW13]GKX66614.1 cell division protein YceG [Clostridium sp. TW13]
MRKRISIIAVCVVVCLAIIFSGVYIFYIRAVNHPLKSNEQTVNIEVTDGDSLYAVLSRLSNKNNLSNLYFIKYYIKKNNLNVAIKPGSYKVLTETSLEKLIKLLQTGGGEKKKITIPEGFTIDDIAKKLDKQGIVTKDKFLEAVKKYSLPSYIKSNKNKRYNLEGFLFPDTYYIEKDDTAEDIIDKMLGRFQEVMSQIANETGITVNEADYEKIINIASIIEEEARGEEDRPLISSVINNRLEKNMKLQIDATVIYAIGHHKDVLLNSDLLIDSPYNVYKYEGLPVGPIANPGKQSIIAALRPNKTDYIYYVWNDKQKKHVFSKDYNKFLKDKKEAGL